MDVSLAVAGIGHAVGSELVSNADLATSLGLEPDWSWDRTGIRERRVCAADEDVLTLARDAVTRACRDADLRLSDLGAETLLLHIQNALTALTPPAATVLARELGFGTGRALSIDGVCAEPIVALEFAALDVAGRPL